MPGAAAVEMNRQGGSGRSVCARRRSLGVARTSSVTWEDHDRLFPAAVCGVTCPSDSCRVWGWRRHPLEAAAGSGLARWWERLGPHGPDGALPGCWRGSRRQP